MLKNNNVLLLQLKKIKWKIILISILCIIIAVMELCIPFLTQKMIDGGIMKRNFPYVLNLVLILIMVYVFNTLSNVYLNILFSKSSVKVITNIKNDVISKLLRYPLSFYDSNKTGYVISRVEEIDSLNSLFSPMFMGFLKSVITFVGAFFVVLITKWELLIVVLIFMPVLFVISKLTSKQILSTSKELSESAADAQGVLHEDVMGLVELKNNNLEEKKENEIKGYVNALAEKVIKRNFFTIIGSESILLFSLISRCVFILIISHFIIKGELSVGSYFSLLAYISNLFYPVQIFTSINLSIQPALAVLSRINFFMDNKIEKEINGCLEVSSINEIEFNKVSFTYPNTEKEVLSNISIRLKKGDKLFVVGPNGTGKTTIAKLLMGFYNDYDGNIFINRENLKGIDRENLRKEIGIVSQKVILFSGSLMDNIKLWDDGRSDKEIYTILKMYGLSRILEEEKYKNLYIKESGKNLSGGQIQEIALSRAVLKDPSLFIFDEPTSNLDQQRKEEFIQYLEKLEDKICIIITHDDFLMSKIDTTEDLVLDLSNTKASTLGMNTYA